MTTLCKDARGELWGLLILAKYKGLCLRRSNMELEPIGPSVAAKCKNLDRLGVPWSIQNRALAYINDCDRQDVWDILYCNPWRKVIDAIISGDKI